MDDFSRPHTSLLRNCNRNQFDDEQLEYFHRIQGETRVRRWVVSTKKVVAQSSSTQEDMTHHTY